MQLKRYEAPTMHEALQLIKGDLGEDAVIFSTKTIEPPRTLRAKRSKKWVEVTAAVERPVNNQLQTGSDNSMMACAEPTELGGTLPGHAEPPDGLKQSSGDTGSALTCGLVHPTLIQQLLNAGIDQALAGHLYGEACMEYGRAQNTRAIDEVLLTTIASRLSIDGPVMLQPGERKKVAFIGPTGVGKTTTLAKIASTYARCSNVKVKIITMDTYRIAAAEQLRIYARIMGLPVVVVSTWQELGNELNRDDGSQLVLIDTAGRNYRDEAQIDELSVWLQAYSDIEAHLLLSSTTSLEVLEAT
ncbi:MAG: hypothetical protein GY868_06300, partial [Deltaproteobacteria bacterium]|nr:hypothetical protein [Deltaproteobacteria bacterium]